MRGRHGCAVLLRNRGSGKETFQQGPEGEALARRYQGRAPLTADATPQQRPSEGALLARWSNGQGPGGRSREGEGTVAQRTERAVGWTWKAWSALTSSQGFPRGAVGTVGSF